MAFALKGTGSASTANSTTADQASLVVTTATTAGAAGDLAVLIYAVDNNATTDIDEVAVTAVTDSGGNQWKKAVEFTNGQGTAQTGATCGIWYSNLRAAISIAGTVTLTFSNATSRDATAASLTYYTKAAGFEASLTGVPGTLANDAAAAGSLNVTTANLPCLRVRGIASEALLVTALTPTASFAIVTQSIASTGTAATSMAVRGEWIINTGTGTASAPTAGAGAVDNASVYAAFTEVPTTVPSEWSSPPSLAKRGLAAAQVASGLFSPVIQPSNTQWFAPFSEPVRRVRTPNKVNLFPFSAQAVASVSMGWFAPLSEPVRVMVSPAKQQVLAFAPNPIVATGWSVPLSEPARAKQRAIADYAYAPLAISEVVTIDKWFNPLADPAKKAGLRTGPSEFTPLFTENSIALNTRFSSLIEPTRTRARPTESPALFFVATTTEAVTVDKWFEPLLDPTRKAGLGAGSQQALAFVAQVAAVVAAPAQWFTPLVDPVRRIPVAQKVNLFPFTASVAVETVTVDKWFVSFTDPVRIKPQLATSSQQSLAFVEAAPFAETVTESRWHQAWSEPVRVKPSFRPAAQTAFFAPSTVITAEVITVDKWLQPFSRPIQSRISVASQQAAFAPITVAETVTPDKWFESFTDPLRKGRVAKATVSAFIAAQTPEIVSVDKWFAALSEPIRQKAGLPVAQQQVLAFVYPVVVVAATDIRWFAPLSEPVRTKVSLPAASQQALAFVKAAPFGEVITNNWFAPLSDPTRRIAAAQKVNLFPFTASAVAETVTVDKWFVSFTDPVRVKPRLATGLQQALAYVEAAPFAETVTESRWHQPWSEPLRSRPGLSAANQAAFFAPSTVITAAEIITVDKWFAELSRPSKPKTSVAVASIPALTISTNPIVSFGWAEPLSDPTRRKPEERDHYKAENEFTAIAANMKWFAPLTEPVRQKIGLSVTQQQALAYVVTIASTEVSTVDKWFVSFQDPVRVKPALLTGRQQFLTWPTQIIIPTMASWWRPLAEPPKPKAGLSARLQSTETEDPKLFPNPARFLEGWFNWWSEPVRKLRQLNAALQQAYTAPDRRAVLTTITVTMAATEVNNDVALFAIKVFAGNPPATAVVSLVEIGHGASLTSIVEEGDDGSGTSIVES